MSKHSVTLCPICGTEFKGSIQTSLFPQMEFYAAADEACILTLPTTNPKSTCKIQH